MNVVNVNAGTKIPYEVSGNKITFNDELMLNLARYEQDDKVSIDICSDKNGNLTMGLSWRYVAQIEIPARTYVETTVDEETKLTAVPFNMDNVTLRLWSID